ncbi:MAG TPA: GNAT family N-acetyltransferase [Chthonomonadales bacterium]|nr:GNAT family N-acetyltransferase [Chthonomonadales bacterium]
MRLRETTRRAARDAGAPELRVEVRRGTDAVREIEQPWLDLWARQALPVADQRPDWLIEYAASREREPAAIAVWCGEALAGVVALTGLAAEVEQTNKTGAARRANMVAGPVLPRDVDEAVCVCHAAFASIPAQQVRLGYVVRDSPLWQAVFGDGPARRTWWAQTLTRDARRWRLAVRGSFDDYLRNQFSKRTAKKREWEVRQLRAACPEGLSVQIITSPEETPILCRAALEVLGASWKAEHSYAAASWSESDARRTAWLAERGLLRAYILRCGGEPLAFVFFSACDGVLLLEKLGYVASWAHRGPGAVLWYLVVQDLHAQSEARCLDFNSQDWEYKSRYATEVALEANVLLVRRTLPSLLAAMPMVARNSLRRQAVAIVERTGARPRLQRWLYHSRSARWARAMHRWLSRG